MVKHKRAREISRLDRITFSIITGTLFAILGFFVGGYIQVAAR